VCSRRWSASPWVTRVPELTIASRRKRLGDGSGTIRWIERSQRYRLRFQQRGARREEYFSVAQYASKRAARAAAEKCQRILAGQVATGRRVVVPRLTVAEQVQAWLVRKRGMPSYEGYVDRAAHVMRHRIGAVPLDRLQGQDVSDFYFELEHEPQPMLKRGVIQPAENWRPLRPKTIKHVAGVLNAALDLAVAQGLMPNGNPTKNERVSPPRVRKRTYDLFDVSEMDRMIEGANGYLKPVLILLCRYGLRPGEALAMRWTDLGVTSLTVARSIRDLDTPKTDAGFRTLPMAAADMGTIRGWRAAVDGSPWLFPADDGKPTRLQTLNRDYARLLQRLGIRYRRPYDCRHTAITMVIAYTHLTDGLSIADVARWAGHAEHSTTLNTYLHLLPTSQGLVEAMARAFQVERLRIVDAQVHGDPEREAAEEI
jgi:integrase